MKTRLLTIAAAIRAALLTFVPRVTATFRSTPVTTDSLIGDVRAKIEALEAHRKAQDAKADAYDMRIAQLVAERAAVQNDAARAWRIARRFSQLLEG